MRNMAAAQQTLQTLTALVPAAANEPAWAATSASGLFAQRWLRLLRAEVAFKQERYADVLQTLMPVQSDAALQRPELMAVAQALTRLPSHPLLKDITGQLRQRVQVVPHDAQAWDALTQLLAKQGQALASLRAEGEAQIARLDWSGAIDRLRAAQDLARTGRLQPGEHIEASIVDVRLRYAQEHWLALQKQR